MMTCGNTLAGGVGKRQAQPEIDDFAASIRFTKQLLTSLARFAIHVDMIGEGPSPSAPVYAGRLFSLRTAATERELSTHKDPARSMRLRFAGTSGASANGNCALPLAFLQGCLCAKACLTLSAQHKRKTLRSQTTSPILLQASRGSEMCENLSRFERRGAAFWRPAKREQFGSKRHCVNLCASTTAARLMLAYHRGAHVRSAHAELQVWFCLDCASRHLGRSSFFY